MREEIFCSHCGANNQAKHFKCLECQAWIRPVYPTFLSVAALAVIYGLWLLFMRTVVPAFAGILSSHGAQFSPWVRVTIGLGQRFTGWGILLGLLFMGVLLWIGLYWRPSKACGRNVVMTVVLLKAVSALAVVLLAAMDVLPYLGSR
jgi:type II secretory pathway component PulF